MVDVISCTYRGSYSRPVTKEEWSAKHEHETENATHPCDHHEGRACMCKGACTCHTIEIVQLDLVVAKPINYVELTLKFGDEVKPCP